MVSGDILLFPISSFSSVTKSGWNPKKKIQSDGQNHNLSCVSTFGYINVLLIQVLDMDTYLPSKIV